MLFVQCGSCVRPCVLEVFPSSAMTAVIGGDIQPSFSRILMSLITCILPSRSWRAIEYSTITQCLATSDVKVIGSLCGGLPLSFPMQHHPRSCLYAYNGPLTRPTYRAVRHIVSIIDRVLVVALSSVVEGVGECRSTIELFSLLSQVYSQRKRGALKRRPYGLVMGPCSREVDEERVFTVPINNCDLDEMVYKGLSLRYSMRVIGR